MKVPWHIAGAVAALAVVVVVGTRLDAEPPRITKESIMIAADDADPVTRAAAQAAAGSPTPLNYATGFEPEQGFTARGTDCVYNCGGADTGACGFIGDGTQGSGPYPEPWAVTDCNLRNIEGHVETVHPFAGTQHLRLSREPCTFTAEFCKLTDARVPASPPLPGIIAPSTYSAQIAIDGLFGANVSFQPQSNSQGLITSRTILFFYGFFYILDDPGDGITFLPIPTNWDTSGGY